MVRVVKAEEAVGKSLAHDVVRYGPGLKAVLFKKGHIVREEDVEKLKDAGNYIVYVEEGELEGVHEDDAALRMALACMGQNLLYSKPNKGRVDLLASISGVLRIKEGVVKKVNLVEDFILATLPDFSGVRKGQRVASMKIVPLSVSETKMREIEEMLCREKPVVEVCPPALRRIGAIITGTEIYEGRVKDAFLPVLQKKLGEFGLQIEESSVMPDDERKIAEKIIEFKNSGKELILVCGGMAVDIKDVTASAIKSTGADVVSRGIPAFPGAMMMISYLGDVAVIGLPACVIPDERTTFDIFLPKLLMKHRISRGEIVDIAPRGLEILSGG
ncbi:MAG: molybdopterin-binding protein [Candidatus Hadarchaeales archaeon]